MKGSTTRSIDLDDDFQTPRNFRPVSIQDASSRIKIFEQHGMETTPRPLEIKDPEKFLKEESDEACLLYLKKQLRKSGTANRKLAEREPQS